MVSMSQIEIQFSFIVFACGLQTLGVSNGPLKFSSARNIWPLLDLLAKFRRVLAKFSQSRLACSAGFSVQHLHLLSCKSCFVTINVKPSITSSVTLSSLSFFLNRAPDILITGLTDPNNHFIQSNITRS